MDYPRDDGFRSEFTLDAHIGIASTIGVQPVGETDYGPKAMI